MDVETFASGAEFLDAMPSCKVDCLLLDLYMPEMDGFEVLNRLAQSGAQLPVDLGDLVRAHCATPPQYEQHLWSHALSHTYSCQPST